MDLIEGLDVDREVFKFLLDEEDFYILAIFVNMLLFYYF